MVPIDKSSIETPEEVLEGEIEELERRVLRSPVPWLAGLAGLGLLAVVWGFVQWEHTPFARRAAARSPVDLAAPRGGLDQAPRIFYWDAVGGAVSYAVTVQSVRGDTVLVRVVERPVLTPVDMEQALLVPGEYVWTVEARDARGAVLGGGRSSFTIRTGG